MTAWDVALAAFLCVAGIHVVVFAMMALVVWLTTRD